MHAVLAGAAAGNRAAIGRRRTAGGRWAIWIFAAVAAGADVSTSALRNAPHTVHVIGSDDWKHPYTREQAAWPMAWLRDAKFWPSVGRIDNAWGDRNLVCSCPPMSEYCGTE